MGKNRMYFSGLNLPTGQKIKLVIAACLWNNPQASFLDTNIPLTPLIPHPRSVS